MDTNHIVFGTFKVPGTPPRGLHNLNKAVQIASLASGKQTCNSTLHITSQRSASISQSISTYYQLFLHRRRSQHRRQLYMHIALLILSDLGGVCLPFAPFINDDTIYSHPQKQLLMNHSYAAPSGNCLRQWIRIPDCTCCHDASSRPLLRTVYRFSQWYLTYLQDSYPVFVTTQRRAVALLRKIQDPSPSFVPKGRTWTCTFYFTKVKFWPQLSNCTHRHSFVSGNAGSHCSRPFFLAQTNF